MEKRIKNDFALNFQTVEIELWPICNSIYPIFIILSFAPCEWFALCPHSRSTLNIQYFPRLERISGSRKLTKIRRDSESIYRESWRDRSYRGESVQRYTRPCISVRTRFPPVTNTIANGSAKLFPILLFSRETANQRTVQSVAQVIGSCLVHVRSAAYRLVRASWNRSIRHRDFSIPPSLSLSLYSRYGRARIRRRCRFVFVE